jgi:hypothetical protein
MCTYTHTHEHMETLELNTIVQMDTHRIFHRKPQNIFSAAHGTLPQIDHI